MVAHVSHHPSPAKINGVCRHTANGDVEHDQNRHREETCVSDEGWSVALTGDRNSAALEGEGDPPLDGQGRVGLVVR